MKKEEFLKKLKEELENANINNTNDIIEYYEEIIDDKIEEGITEKEAVSSIGSIDTIIKNELLDRPMTTIIKEKVKDKKEKAEKNGTKPLLIALIILGIPVWVPLLIGLIGIIIGILCSVFGIIIALFASILGIGIASIACLFTCIVSIFTNSGHITLMVFSVGLILAGLVMLLIPFSALITKGIINIIKTLIKGIKKIFV